MQEKITIEGNRPVEILDGLRKIGVLDEYSHLDTDNTKFEITFKTPQPTFSVGMRVECIRHFDYKSFTYNMVYKIIDEDTEAFYVINDLGYKQIMHKGELKDYFTPYEKPEKGEDYQHIESGILRISKWENDSYDNNRWNLGLAFKTKEQAEFARERLSKLF